MKTRVYTVAAYVFFPYIYNPLHFVSIYLKRPFSSTVHSKLHFPTQLGYYSEKGRTVTSPVQQGSSQGGGYRNVFP